MPPDAMVAPDSLVFPTARGTARDKDNVRERVLRPVVRRADEILAERKQLAMPANVTTHKLRHTFGSVLAALDENPTNIAAQLGHTDPAFTLRVYAHAMRRDPGSKGAPTGTRGGPGLGTIGH